MSYINIVRIEGGLKEILALELLPSPKVCNKSAGSSLNIGRREIIFFQMKARPHIICDGSHLQVPI